MKKLVLFDIDGTILSTGGAGTRSVLWAMKTVFGREVGVEDGYSMGGKTDAQIVIELLEGAGIGREETIRKLERIWTLYTAELEREIKTYDPTVHPGVPELLERLQPDVLLGLLTGNVERAAWTKVGRVGLDRYFRMGAFGDKAPERRLLPEVAVREAEALVGRRFEGKDIVIIGDTPNDILCGRHLLVKAVAVATGSYSAEELAEYEPDYLFENLCDTKRAAEAVLS